MFLITAGYSTISFHMFHLDPSQQMTAAALEQPKFSGCRSPSYVLTILLDTWMPRKFGKPCLESNWVKHQLRKDNKNIIKIVTIIGSFRNFILKSKVIYLFCFKYFAFQILYDIWPLWQTKVLVRWMPVGRGTPHPSCCWLPAAPIRPAISDWQIFNGPFLVFFLFRP